MPCSTCPFPCSVLLEFWDRGTRPHHCLSAPPRQGGTGLIDYIPRSGAATAPALDGFPMGAGSRSKATRDRPAADEKRRRMSLRFGINGVGRIGRALLRLAHGTHGTHGREELVPAAVNDVVPAGVLAPLLARDTVHGPFPGTVAASGRGLALDGREVLLFAVPEPAENPWASAGVRVVVEATGRFLGRSRAAA